MKPPEQSPQYQPTLAGLQESDGQFQMSDSLKRGFEGNVSSDESQQVKIMTKLKI